MVGSMRNASAVSADGPANLLSGVRVAAAPGVGRAGSARRAQRRDPLGARRPEDGQQPGRHLRRGRVGCARRRGRRPDRLPPPARHYAHTADSEVHLPAGGGRTAGPCRSWRTTPARTRRACMRSWSATGVGGGRRAGVRGWTGEPGDASGRGGARGAAGCPVVLSSTGAGGSCHGGCRIRRARGALGRGPATASRARTADARVSRSRVRRPSCSGCSTPTDVPPAVASMPVPGVRPGAGESHSSVCLVLVGLAAGACARRVGPERLGCRSSAAANPAAKNAPRGDVPRHRRVDLPGRGGGRAYGAFFSNPSVIDVGLTAIAPDTAVIDEWMQRVRRDRHAGSSSSGTGTTTTRWTCRTSPGGTCREARIVASRTVRTSSADWAGLSQGIESTWPGRTSPTASTSGLVDGSYGPRVRVLPTLRQPRAALRRARALRRDRGCAPGSEPPTTAAEWLGGATYRLPHRLPRCVG